MKLQEGVPFIIADGQEYLDAEPIETPGGQAAVLSDQNPLENETNQDALGVGRVNGLVFGAVADGIGSLPDSQLVASAYVRESMRIALESYKDREKINPKWVNWKTAELVRANCPPVNGATVGTFFVVQPNGVVHIHRFGDPEFGHGRREGSFYQLEVAPRKHLMPQNQGLQRHERKEIDEWAVLRPRGSDRVVTHYIHAEVGSHMSKGWAKIQLRPGEWLSITTDGARVYKRGEAYMNWLNANPNGTPRELAKFASCMVLDGNDNGSGFFYRHGV